jgi:hypothetical protein
MKLIFLQLRDLEFFVLSQVCSEWKQITSDNGFWRLACDTIPHSSFDKALLNIGDYKLIYLSKMSGKIDRYITRRLNVFLVQRRQIWLSNIN